MLAIDRLNQLGSLSAQQQEQLTFLTGRLRVNEDRIQAAFDLHLQVHVDLGARETGFVSRQIAASQTGVGGFRRRRLWRLS